MRDTIEKIIHENVVKRTVDCRLAERKAADLLIEEYNKRTDVIFDFINNAIKKIKLVDKLSEEDFKKFSRFMNKLSSGSKIKE